MGPGQYENEKVMKPAVSHIPDEWAGKGHCPVCDVPNTLDVIHLEGTPDQFLCQSCTATFEIQAGTSNIRLKVLPAILKPEWGKFLDRWIDPSEALAAYEDYSSQKDADEASKEEPIQPELTDQEVLYRAVELKKLGNNNQTIELLLDQAGARPDQITAAMARIHQRFDQAEKGKSQVVMWMGILAVLIIAVIAALIWLFNLMSPQRPELNPTGDTFFRNLLPIDELTGFVGGPTPQVVPADVARANCPATSQDAANLFGGDSMYWSKSRENENAWTLLNTGEPVNIRLPGNMFAGILNLETRKIQSVSGPAFIRNANFIVITCE